MEEPVSENGQGNPVTTVAGRQQMGHRFGYRPIVRIHLLGPMRATTCLGDDILPRGKESRAILGRLCLAAGKPVLQGSLAALLWDRMPDTVAQGRLQKALHELSAAFGAFAKELLFTDPDTIRLNVEACWIDALAVASPDTSAPNGSHCDLPGLCEGELLDELDGVSAALDRWLLDERIRFRARLQSRMKLGLRRHAGHGEAREKNGKPGLPGTRVRAARGRTRLRIGVLPFMSDGPGRVGDLALSLSQEIAGALTRFRWFDVIAPVSLRLTPSRRFVGGHELRRMGLDYVVDGTVSSNNKGLQISLQLRDLADDMQPVWLECFNLPIRHLHRLNELATVRIVGVIDPVALSIERSADMRRERYGATGLILQAIPLMSSKERWRYEDAGRLIAHAVELEPDNATVAAWAARWHLFYIMRGWGKHTKQAFAIAQGYARRAIKFDPDNADAMGIYAHYCAFAESDFDAALCYFDRALRLNPSLASNWVLSAATHCYIGEPDIALQKLERYRELAPVDPYSPSFENCCTIANVFREDYEQAALVGRRAVNAAPDFVNGYKPLIASLGHLGRRAQAKPYVNKLLSLEPEFTAERHGQVYPFKNAGDRRRYIDGLCLAGVPRR